MIRFARACITAFVLVAACLAAGPADAQLFLRQDVGGFYLGGGVGASQARNFCDDAGAFVGSCDDKDTAWKISGGYRFNRYVSAEIGYVNLGKISFDGRVGATPFSGSARTDGVEFLAVGYLPLAQGFSLFGKLGAFLWDSRGDVAVGSFAGGGKDNGTDVTYGLGLQYDFNRNLSARLEWQRYNNIDVDTFGVAALWTFR